MIRKVYHADNMTLLPTLDDEMFDLIYIDPPFNTGKKQSRKLTKTVRSKDGDRVGFKGQKYETKELFSASYNDDFDDFEKFIYPRLEQAHRLLKPTGSLFVHLDYRESHYCKVWLDKIFGRNNFRNEIIWAYDYGSRSKNKWSAKHDNIFWYTKSDEFTFNYDDMERIPYMAPGLQKSKEKADKGKTPTDVWWHTIVPPCGKEKTGYPTQKPLGIINRIMTVHSNPDDLILDFFAGSGTLGVSAFVCDRQFILIDQNPEAIAIITKRLKQELGFEFDTVVFESNNWKTKKGVPRGCA